jgi:uncharacterized membrane protein
MRYFFLLGRIIFGGFFIFFGGRHFTRLAVMVPHVAAKGVPLPTLAVLGSGLGAVLAGASILFGLRPRWGVALVALFLIPVSITIAQLLGGRGSVSAPGERRALREERSHSRGRPDAPRHPGTVALERGPQAASAQFVSRACEPFRACHRTPVEGAP